MHNGTDNMYMQVRDFDENENHLFYDWFCSDSSLPRKSKALIAKVKRIFFSPRFDATKCYIFFKNNCPVSGSLYDDFRIRDIESGNLLFTVVPKSGHACRRHESEVWARYNNFGGPVFEGTWKETIEWFNHPERYYGKGY